MLKKVTILALFCLLSLPLLAQERFVEGQHYNVISSVSTSKPEILVFYSAWDSNCYNFEPIVQQLESRLSIGARRDHKAELTKVHVNFMAFAKPSVQDEVTRAMMVARTMGRENLFTNAIFKYIHVQKAAVTGQADLRNILMVYGFDPKVTEKKWNSFDVNRRVKENNQLIKRYSKHLRGVPNFIVNGKYQAKFTRSMSPEDMIDLLLWLAKQK